MDKVLILGVTGFTGRHLQQYIIQNKLNNSYQFIGLDKISAKSSVIELEQCDLLDWNQLRKQIVAHKPDYIINLIGLFYSDDSDLVIQTNTLISKHILECVVQHNLKVKRIVLIGSAAEYGNCSDLPLKETSHLKPVNYYGLSKSWQTSLAKYTRNNHGLNISIARTFNIIGKDMSSQLSIGSFIKQINELSDQGVLKVGNIDTKRDFIDIEDVIDAYWKILTQPHDEFIFNVCSGNSISIRSMIEFLISKSGKKITIETDRSRIKAEDIQVSYGSNEKAKKVLNWDPKNDIFSTLSDAINQSSANNS